MLRNAAKSFECPFGEGETGEVPEALAQQLIALNIAVPVSEPETKKVKAVPPTPAVKGE